MLNLYVEASSVWRLLFAEIVVVSRRVECDGNCVFSNASSGAKK